MKNDIKLLVIIVVLVAVTLVVSLSIKNNMNTVSKGVEEEIPTSTVNLDAEVGPTLTDEQVEEVIEKNKETGGFYDTNDDEEN